MCMKCLDNLRAAGIEPDDFMIYVSLITEEIKQHPEKYPNATDMREALVTSIDRGELLAKVAAHSLQSFMQEMFDKGTLIVEAAQQIEDASTKGRAKAEERARAVIEQILRDAELGRSH